MGGSIVPPVEAGTLKRTPLYEAIRRGREAGAVRRLGKSSSPTTDVAEHLRVRNSCGVFDVSHMGEIDAEGPQATELLQRLLSNDVLEDRPQRGAYMPASAARTAGFSMTSSPTGSARTAI